MLGVQNIEERTSFDPVLGEWLYEAYIVDERETPGTIWLARITSKERNSTRMQRLAWVELVSGLFEKGLLDATQKRERQL